MSRVAMFVSLVMGLSACIGPAKAAPRTVNPDISLTPAPLSASQLLALAAPVTREQQISALQRGPKAVRDALAAALNARLATRGMTPGSVAKAYADGIVLTPLCLQYPASATNTEATVAGVSTTCAFVSSAFPLPSAEQKPPLLWLQAPYPSYRLLSVRFRAAGAAGYALTYNVTPPYTIAAPPKVEYNWPGATPGGNGIEVVTVPNAEKLADATHWTALLSITKGDAEVEANFVVAWQWKSKVTPWSALTIRKL